MSFLEKKVLKFNELFFSPCKNFISGEQKCKASYKKVHWYVLCEDNGK